MAHCDRRIGKGLRALTGSPCLCTAYVAKPTQQPRQQAPNNQTTTTEAATQAPYSASAPPPPSKVLCPPPKTGVAGFITALNAAFFAFCRRFLRAHQWPQLLEGFNPSTLGCQGFLGFVVLATHAFRLRVQGRFGRRPGGTACHH